ncbi:MAG TPA: FG-GAP-like repeat-containing protein, partial [Bacteroidia bacterium]
MTTAKNLIGIFIYLIAYSANAQMFVFGFSPSNGIVGSTVTIDGSGFDATASNNLVFFGGTPAVVTSATTSKLEVDVPSGISSNAVITVLNTVTGLQATVDKPFVCLFNHGISSLLPASYQYVFQKSSNFGPNLFGENISDYSGKKMMSGDFDGDGKLDLVAMGTSVASTMYVFRNVNPSSGTKLDSMSFDTAVIIGLDANSTTTSCFPYDMDNDGKLDTLIGRTNGFSIFINTSTGVGDISFAKNTINPTGTYSSQKCLASDLDFDGDLEVIAINPNGGSRLSYFNNTGSPGSLSISTTATNIILPQSCGDFLLADLDDDDDKDIIVVSNNNTGSSSNESIYYFENTNTSIGTISISGTANLISGTVPAGNYNVSVPMASADFDDDGDMDLVTVSKGGLSDPSLVQVHKNLGFGSFSTLDVGSYYMSDGFTFLIRTGDINGDGRPDIVFHDGNSNGDFKAILNQYISGSLGSNHFTTYSGITALSLIPTGFVLDDFNQDGQLDIITNELGTSNLHYFTNGTAIFYAKSVASDSLNLTTSWSSAEDGTGNAPPDFSAGTFFLNNSSNTATFNSGGDWNMGGALVVPNGKKLYIKDSSQFNLTGSIDNLGYINGGNVSSV